MSEYIASHVVSILPGRSCLFRAPTHAIQQAQSLGAVRIASFELKPTEASDCTFHDMPANQTAVDKVGVGLVRCSFLHSSPLSLPSPPSFGCLHLIIPLPRSPCGRARPPCLCGKCRVHGACRPPSRALCASSSCSREAKAGAPPPDLRTICISTCSRCGLIHLCSMRVLLRGAVSGFFVFNGVI